MIDSTAPSRPVLETQRLVLRRFMIEDAAFVRELVNDPGWLRYIGDRQVHTTEDAENYLRNGPMASYAKYGFGLDLVSLRDGTPIGMCGLIKRDVLDDVDLGFALLARFAGHGYALEAAQAVVAYARSKLKLPRLAAITQPDNIASMKLLSKLGFGPAGKIRLRPETEELLLHAVVLNP